LSLFLLTVGHSLYFLQGLPGEIEKILLRPSIANHYASLLTQALLPVIERQIKESLSGAFLQFHAQHSTTLQQEIMRELRNEIASIKSDLGSRQNESLRSQEATIRDLERSVGALSEQVKYLTINKAPPSQISTLHHLPQPQQAQNTPTAPPPTQLQANVGGSSHLRNMTLAPSSNGGTTYAQPIAPFQQAPPQPPIHQQWYTSIAAPQASHPTTIPQPTTATSQDDKTPPPPSKTTTSSGSTGTAVTTPSEDWDSVYLKVLTSQDANRLRSLLSRTNPEVVLPLNGPPLVSQAVILTLVHRVCFVFHCMTSSF
jgi:hypothetical protein